MGLALLADVHANLEALDACLAHARSHGAERFVFLGDIVGYGADPVAVIERVASLAAKGAIVVRGNHDEAVSSPVNDLGRQAAAAIAWTRTVLSPAHRDFLQSLPLRVDHADACFVHASPLAPARWDYVDSAHAADRGSLASALARVFCGHVHDAMLYVSNGVRMIPFRPRPGVPVPVPAHRRSLAVVGSVGQPRDGNCASAYAMVDLSRGWMTFHRVVYDNLAAAAKVRKAGLPEILAYRLERGV